MPSTRSWYELCSQFTCIRNMYQYCDQGGSGLRHSLVAQQELIASLESMRSGFNILSAAVLGARF